MCNGKNAGCSSMDDAIISGLHRPCVADVLFTFTVVCTPAPILLHAVLVLDTSSSQASTHISFVVTECTHNSANARLPACTHSKDAHARERTTRQAAHGRMMAVTPRLRIGSQKTSSTHPSSVQKASLKPWYPVLQVLVHVSSSLPSTQTPVAFLKSLALGSVGLSGAPGHRIFPPSPPPPPPPLAVQSALTTQPSVSQVAKAPVPSYPDAHSALHSSPRLPLEQFSNGWEFSPVVGLPGHCAVAS